jgi:hypothetical protein
VELQKQQEEKARLVSKGTIALVGLGIAGLVAFFIFKGTGQAPANSNPTSVQTPVSVTPSSLFNSTPSLSTGGSGSGNFTLAQTYSPYYSTSNTYTNQTTTTTTSNPQTTLKIGLF